MSIEWRKQTQREIAEQIAEDMKAKGHKAQVVTDSNGFHSVVFDLTVSAAVSSIEINQSIKAGAA